MYEAATKSGSNHRLRVGMAVYSDITYDSRVQREAETIAAAGHRVILACLPGRGPMGWSPAGVSIIPLLPRRTSTLPGTPVLGANHAWRMRPPIIARIGWLMAYAANLRAWGSEVAAAIAEVDAWHLHDLTALSAISPHVPDDVPIIYDSHELFLDTGAPANLPASLRSILRFEEARRIRRVDTLVTVNDELASILGRRYRPRRIVVIHNCPPRATRHPGPDRIRAATGVPTDAAVILHHGALTGGRGIETLTAAMLEPGLDRAHLVLLGFGPLADAMRVLGREPRFGGRLHVVDAVPSDELVDWISSADVGAIARPASDINYEMSTPNKLFECLAAGVPVVASGRATRRIVEDPGGPLGVICDPTSPAAVASAIRSILELEPLQRLALRARCRAAADRRWNWESEASKLTGIYERLAGAPWPRVVPHR